MYIDRLLYIPRESNFLPLLSKLQNPSDCSSPTACSLFHFIPPILCYVLLLLVHIHPTYREVTVQLQGGDLQIEWREKDNHIYMTGPADLVYSATLGA